MMLPVLLLLLALSIVRGADQNLTVEGPAGVINGTGHTTVITTHDQTTFNYNLSLVVDVAGGHHMHPGPGPSGPPASRIGTSFEQDGLNAHNYYRVYHDSPPMTLNNEMNAAAAAYAQKIARTGTMKHSRRDERQGQGENLYMSCTSQNTEATATVAVKKWYDEVCIPGYPFGSLQKPPPGTGHFTQVVWSDSIELGIGKATAQKGSNKCTYVVARYKPTGNLNTGIDDYNKNVKKGANFDKQKYCSSERSKQFLVY